MESHPEYSPKSPRFNSILAELTELKDRVVKTRNWYDRRAPRSMAGFRIVGVTVILLSVSLPFLGTLEGAWRSVALPVVSLLIAGLTGVNAFLNWQQQWQSFRQTQFTLEYLLQRWELDVIQARYLPDEEDAIIMIYTATQKLLDQAREATASETSEFFKGTQLPAGK
jgi:hypothetical protein